MVSDTSMRALPSSVCARSSAGRAGAQVTLWDPSANTLVAVLPPPAAHAPGAPFTRLAFVPGTPYLAGASAPAPQAPHGAGGGGSAAPGTLAVWNLLTAALWWSHAVSVTALAADPGGGGGFAVALPPLPSGAAPAAGRPGSGEPGGGSAAEDGASQGAASRLPNGTPAEAAAVLADARHAQAAVAGDDRQAGAHARAEAGADARLVGPSGVVPHTPEGLHRPAGRGAGRPTTAVRPAASSAGAAAAGAVLLFDAASARPAAAWALPGARAAALLFAPPGTPLAGAGAALAHPGAGSTPDGTAQRAAAAASPLLILTEDRRYVVARPAGAAGAAARAPALAEAGAVAERGQGAVGYEAAFGRLQEAAQLGAPAAAAAGAAAADAAAAAAAAAGSWRGLFDAPSHALPPLSVLCPAFLELMVGARQAPAEDE